uniref:Uncharacterized protein n=1 Tax=Ananas comosus var. bracteatus TaxID=296719 RepID=A0A6V7QHC9_ANACO|nr:unnamed protein product [Ananas comosus var. bracteatus]
MRRKKSRLFMDGGDRSHSHRSSGGGGGPGSELFICFTSRPSSSSSSASAAAMRAPSSKSLLSPGRNGAGAAPSAAAAPSLSASLSRRLRSSGSVKGAQSPMFPAAAAAAAAAAAGGGRRKGAAFEAAEPTSPKVTCIGQVRVKGKKKKKGQALRSRSRREASFRREGAGRERGQGWVHQIPVSICEALRAFGSEFSCLLPCGGRSFCSSASSSSKATNAAAAEEEEEEKGRGEKPRGMGSCGAAFARWLMAVEESEEGKRGKVVGVVVEEREEEMGFLTREKVAVAVAVAEAEKKDEILVMGKEKEEVEGAEEEAARVSVCVPPRNALLLMRCRSDPVRMAALANRFWGSPSTKVQEEEEGEDEEEEEEEEDEEEEEEEEEENSGERDELGGEGCVEVGVEENDGGADAVEADLVGREAAKSSQEALLL